MSGLHWTKIRRLADRRPSVSRCEVDSVPYYWVAGQIRAETTESQIEWVEVIW